MEYLRWVLLVFGILALGAVVFFSLRERNMRRALRDSPSRPSGWDHDDGFEVGEVRVVSGADDIDEDVPLKPAPQSSVQSTNSATEEQAEPATERVVQLYLRCSSGDHWTGADIRTAAISEQLILGRDGFFESRDGQGAVAFYVANMLKPGTFKLNELGAVETPGLILFLALPAAIDDLEAWDKMLQTGRQLADRLEGELLDEAQQPLSPQTIAYIRDSISAEQ